MLDVLRPARARLASDQRVEVGDEDGQPGGQFHGFGFADQPVIPPDPVHLGQQVDVSDRAYVFVNAVVHSGVYTWLGLYFRRRYGLGEVGIGLAILGYGVPGFAGEGPCRDMRVASEVSVAP